MGKTKSKKKKRTPKRAPKRYKAKNVEVKISSTAMLRATLDSSITDESLRNAEFYYNNPRLTK